MADNYENRTTDPHRSGAEVITTDGQNGAGDGQGGAWAYEVRCMTADGSDPH